MSNFRKDLQLGQASEIEFAQVLTNKGWCVEFNTASDIKTLKLWDLKAVHLDKTILIEVKTDLMFKQTGNVAVEIDSILFSEANIIVYKLDIEFYQITREKLLNNLGTRIVWGGDGGRSQLALIKVDKFKEMCKLVTNEDSSNCE